MTDMTLVLFPIVPYVINDIAQQGLCLFAAWSKTFRYLVRIFRQEKRMRSL